MTTANDRRVEIVVMAKTGKQHFKNFTYIEPSRDHYVECILPASLYSGTQTSRDWHLPSRQKTSARLTRESNMGAKLQGRGVRPFNFAMMKPVMRAYALGYASSIIPRLLGLLRNFRRKDKTVQEKLDLLYHILRTATQVNRFPTSCAIIVGGTTLLPRLLRIILVSLTQLVRSSPSFLLSKPATTRLRFVCTFVSAWFAFDLLNRDLGWTRKRALSRSSRFFQPLQDSPNQHHRPPATPPLLAGKTVDFTLFALTRAIDAVAITIWTRTRSHPWHPEQRTPQLASLTRYLADPAIFAFSAAVIMGSWFYSPTRLPRAYNHWISTAAAIDSRLISALRLARQGDFIYGQDTGQAPVLEPLCEELNLPLAWADPAKTIPIPCEIVHMGVGPSCEVHALSRFFRSWLFAMEMYLPLQLLLRLRSPSLRSFSTGLKGAARSSAFLGAFVSFFYYGVCLSRTRLGPKLFSRKTVTPQMWDSGLCVLAGCMACGWSILLEKRSRRQEIAFFVVPRALATLLPRVYEKRYRIREQTAFATSVAIVMAIVAERPQRVRGAFGQVLGKVLSE